MYAQLCSASHCSVHVVKAGLVDLPIKPVVARCCYIEL